jgi:hypothetical protein
VQHRKQSRVYEQGSGSLIKLGTTSTAEAPGSAAASSPDGGTREVKPHHPQKKQMRIESDSVPQEGALQLHAPKLLKERKREDLRVREPPEGPVASSTARWLNSA